MAPQTSFYGSVAMEDSKEERPSRFARRALVAVGVVVLVSLAVFAVSSSMARPSVSIDIKATKQPKFLGDDLPKWGPDCACRFNVCPKKAWADGKTRCAVLSKTCMGADYGDVVSKASKSLRKDTTVDCKKGTGEADATCFAVCDVAQGRNQCDKYPCLNHGWCKDGKNTYKCFCTKGWTGANCEKDINECDFEGKKHPCAENSICTNSLGAYSCACKPGFEGRGYQDPANVAVPSWMTKDYNANKANTKYVYGCQDIDDCAVNRCKNKGVCKNSIGVVDGWSCDCLKGATTKQALYVGEKDCGTDVDECAAKTHDCDPNSECVNEEGPTGDGFKCVCNDNWTPVDPCGDNHFGRKLRRGLKAAATCAKAKAGGGKYMAGCFDIDDCATKKPCKNGGTCTEGAAGCWDPTKNKGKGGPVDCYVCTCKVGWSGKNCDEDEDECVDSDAGPTKKTYTPTAACKDTESATCVNTAGSFGCRCNLGWTGNPMIKCVDANDCEFNPCAHGGTCRDCGTLCFTCDCVAGWRGTTCGMDWNECLMGIHNCHDSATCVNTPGSFACKCDPGYTGTGVGSSWVEKIVYKVSGVSKTKTVQHGCKDIDDCAAALYDGTGLLKNWNKNWNQGPCQYGTCKDVGANAYSCTCWDGWTDSNCDTNINECDTTSGTAMCSRHATCINREGKGDPSAEVPTRTGASCRDAKSKFNTNAKCLASKMGKMHPTGTKCTNADATKCTKEECCAKATLYSCECNKGFTGNGVVCTDIMDCKKDTCKHGFCRDLGVEQYDCTCNDGWQDTDCDGNINECSSDTHECGDDALCVDTAGSYYCTCPRGYAGWKEKARIGKGVACQDIDDCKLNLCKNSVKCTDGGVEVYTCKCKNGWTDYNCDYDINECMGEHGCWPGGESIEKHHEGRTVKFPAAKCVNTQGSYKCQCQKGMIGRGLKTSKEESMTNGAYKAYLGKANTVKKSGGHLGKVKSGFIGGTMKQKLPEGCVDYDDCTAAGRDGFFGTPDDTPIADKCGSKGNGKCIDIGPNRFKCKCKTGWGCNAFTNCDNDCDECADRTHNCHADALCRNTIGSFECTCKYPVNVQEGANGGGFWGKPDGLKCSPCTVCKVGFQAKGICKSQDRTCEDINECATGANLCDDHAACKNNPGSYSCKCNQGYFASTSVRNARKQGKTNGCTKCTKCHTGFHEVEPCTPMSDRVCKRDVSSAYVPQLPRRIGAAVRPFDANDSPGANIIKTEADENMQCLTIAEGDWYPSRVDYGNGNKFGKQYCGAKNKGQWKNVKPRVTWSFTALGDNTAKDDGAGISDLYLIRYGGKFGPCLFFGDHGKDIYPSLQHCKDYANDADCPWVNADKKMPFCGWEGEGSKRANVLKNMQAVWKVTTLKLNENKFILQSGARSTKNPRGVPKFDCLVFEKQGTATNPSRYNWGNGERMCGVGNWGDTTLELALMNNKQAVFILSPL